MYDHIWICVLIFRDAYLLGKKITFLKLATSEEITSNLQPELLYEASGQKSFTLSKLGSKCQCPCLLAIISTNVSTLEDNMGGVHVLRHLDRTALSGINLKEYMAQTWKFES